MQVLPDSIACRIYVLVVLVETAIDLAIEGDLLIRINDANQAATSVTSKKMPVYLTVFSLAQCVALPAHLILSFCCIDDTVSTSIWQFVLALDAVYARNTLQFIALA
jgi:hypothetical protein